MIGDEIVVSKNRKLVLSTRKELPLDDIFGNQSVESAFKKLAEFVAPYSDKNCRFSIHIDYHDVDLYLDIYREETDREYERRLNKEKRIRQKEKEAKEAIKKKELELLEKLKAKYEKGV